MVKSGLERLRYITARAKSLQDRAGSKAPANAREASSLYAEPSRMPSSEPSADAASAAEEKLPRVGEPVEPPEAFTPVVLEKLDDCLYRGPKDNLWRPTGARGVFGGQVLGQSLAAASGTVGRDKTLHSMHSYFLRAGKETIDIIYHVLVLRDGRSFATRLVTAQQMGQPIFVLIASFQKPSITSLSHQDVMPMVPNPESLPTEEDYLLRMLDDPRCPENYRELITSRAKRVGPFDIRRVLAHDYFHGAPYPDGWRPPEYPKYTSEFRQIMWMRTHKKLPDDEDVHRSVLAYASDMGLLGTAKGTTPIHDLAMVASLDHSMWFHQQFRMDEWILYEMESPRVNNERGLAFGKLFRRDGTLAVTVSQEGLLRLRRDVEEAPTKPAKL